MIVCVHLFARARDLAETDRVSLELPIRATIRDVRVHLVKLHPALATLLPRCAVAVDDEFASDQAPVRAESRIAVLPPVSGG